MWFCKVCNASIAFEVIELDPFVASKLIRKEGRVPTVHVEVANLFLEERIPGLTSFDSRFFEDDLEFNDFETIVDDCVISENSRPAPVYKNKYLNSVVRSLPGTKKRNTLKCNLITFESRNFNADTTCNVGSAPHVAKRLAIQTADTFFNPISLKGCSEDPISQNKVAFSAWAEKRDGPKWKSLLRECAQCLFDLGNLSRYTLMVKADGKPKLDSSVLTNYVTGQNIVYSDKVSIARFSHIFQQAAERLKFVSREKVLFFCGVTIEDFAEQVEERLGDISQYYCYELDISKYDKSQAGLMKDTESILLRMLGVEEGVINFFFSGEYDSNVVMHSKELALSIGSQRRSGGANTWLGNTMVLLSLLSILLDRKPFDLVLASGDDSLIFSKEPLNLDTTILSSAYGFDVKLNELSVPYFCSKYFVSTNDGLRFVPDPFKLLMKAGYLREDDDNLIHEHFKSFVDLTGSFNSEEVVQELVKLDERKYGYNSHAYEAFCLIHVLRANFSQYKRLYDEGSQKGERSKAISKRR
nr:RNA-dependent RNA polymerase [Grapevine leafroll-associated virus 13]